MAQQQNINIDFSSLDSIGCDHCGGIYFQEAVVLKRIPGLMVGQPQDVEYPVPILLCGQCGKPKVPGKPEKKEENKLHLV